MTEKEKSQVTEVVHLLFKKTKEGKILWHYDGIYKHYYVPDIKSIQLNGRYMKYKAECFDFDDFPELKELYLYIRNWTKENIGFGGG